MNRPPKKNAEPHSPCSPAFFLSHFSDYFPQFGHLPSASSGEPQFAQKCG